ncbi:MAG: hypothetical protein IJB82_04935 [Bacilli bacterium]|nr:hypothetical protein [Bacilli bacterium]
MKKENKIKNKEINGKKMKLNKKKILVFLEIITLLALITIVGIKAYNDFFKTNKKEPTNIVNEKGNISEYGYKLEDRDTEIFETYYNELEKVLTSKEIDYDKYAELLSKLFIIDLYTLKNKLTSTDIGSLDFIHPNSLDNFKLKAGDTLYKSVLSNLYNERTQVLPEVSDVNVDALNKTTFNYAGVDYEAYEVICSWSYVEDLGYDTSRTLILIKVENKLFVVSLK